MSRRSHISSDRAPVPTRWRHSSAWSPTTLRGTRPATEFGYPGRSFRLSLKFGSHSQRTPAVRLAQAMTGNHRNGDSESRLAIAAGPSMPDRPLQCRSSPSAPSDFEGILPPPPHTTCCAYLSQADTHLLRFGPRLWLSATVARAQICDHALKYLEANHGAEIVTSIDAGLRQALPNSLLTEARHRMSALLLATPSRLNVTPGIWSDASRLWNGPAAWRLKSRTLLESYLRQRRLGPYDLCPCGSYEKVKFCCQAALEHP
jgi:hypothetical protein